jgi:hypothetical protein
VIKALSPDRIRSASPGQKPSRPGNAPRAFPSRRDWLAARLAQLVWRATTEGLIILNAGLRFCLRVAMALATEYANQARPYQTWLLAWPTVGTLASKLCINRGTMKRTPRPVSDGGTARSEPDINERAAAHQKACTFDWSQKGAFDQNGGMQVPPVVNAARPACRAARPRTSLRLYRRHATPAKPVAGPNIPGRSNAGV